MKLTRTAYFILGFYCALLIFWLCSSFFVTGSSHSTFSLSNLLNGFKNNTQYGYIFAFGYAFIPLIGSLAGFTISRKWGFFKNPVSKAVFFLSLSLFSWSMGEFIWAYYNFFLNAKVPYPSWADVGFVLNYPFWGIGMVYLGEASGAKLGLHQTSRKILLVLIPVFVSLFSWYFMVILARGGSLTSGGGIVKVFFDIAYPAGDVILLTMGLLIFGLSFRHWNAQLKWPVIIILIGILSEYIADFGFSYTTTVNTFFNGGWVDLAYTTSLMILALAVTLLDVQQEAVAVAPVINPVIPSPQTVVSNIPPPVSDIYDSSHSEVTHTQ